MMSDASVRTGFAKWLFEARRLSGMSQAQLAEKAGLESSETVARYERGEREPRLSVALRLAASLGRKDARLTELISEKSSAPTAIAADAAEAIGALALRNAAVARAVVAGIRAMDADLAEK